MTDQTQTKTPDMMNDREIEAFGVTEWVHAYARYICPECDDDDEAWADLVTEVYEIIKNENEFLKEEYPEHYSPDKIYLQAYDIAASDHRDVVLGNLRGEISQHKLRCL